MSSVDIKQMMLPDFWKMISDINWTKNYTSSSAANNKIMVSYPPYKANYFKNIAYDFAAELANLYCNKVRKINHYAAVVASYEVISKGKKIYDEFLNTPSKLQEILEHIDLNNEDGLFIFSLPSDDDYFKDTVSTVKTVEYYDDEY